MRWRIVAGVLMGMLLVSGLLPVYGQQREVTERGRRLYEIYCQNCHGPDGRGDGPTARVMTVKPADLTRLAIAHRNSFPFDRTYKIIDGRQEIVGHGASGMPIWGLQFQDSGSDANQEDAVRGRILQLIEYLRSIQAPPDST